MSLKIKTNFSFNKLSKKTPSLLNQYLNEYAKASVGGTRQNIDTKKNVNGENLVSMSKPSGQPLIDTKDMYNTLKASNNTLKINEYGWGHNEGLYRVKQGTFLRNFIGASKETEELIDKKFDLEIEKALSK
jgi:hypothetical protein